MSARQRRNVWVSGRRTSVSLEFAMWDALREVCEREGRNIDQLCSLIDERRQRASLASSLRIFALAYFRAIARRHLRRSGHPDGAEEDSTLEAALARLPSRRRRPAGQAPES
jgi:predicted DNA-binding ribbon-helix-helix protein